MFTFTPLLGARSSSPAVQSLLEFDGGIKILVDVGWNDSFDAEILKELERQVPTISFILLTHATIAHLGAYAHCCKHIPLFNRIPVYATTPVVSLGRTLLQDLYSSTPLAASLLPTSSLTESSYTLPTYKSENPNILLPPPSNEEIAEYFSIINQLKYLQPHQPVASPFAPPLDGLTITAHCAGHTLGGTIWHIQYGSESIVYAVDWNQARERVLPGAAWLATGAEVVEQLRKPTALVCSSKGANLILSAGGRQQRDEQLLDIIRTAIKEDGSVLIPCDSSARVLELAYMLERAWGQESNAQRQESLHNAKLYFASPTSGTTMRYARSMLEWMDESIVRDFEAAGSAAQQGRGHGRAEQPFEFKHLKLIERKSQLDRALAGQSAKVFLASHTSLDWGYSQSILQQFADKEQNIVVLTERTQHAAATDNTESDIFKRLWAIVKSRVIPLEEPEQALNSSLVQCDGDEVQIRNVQTSPLAGDELPIYQQYLARHRQRQNTLHMDKSSNLESSADAVDDRSSNTSSSDDSDDEHQGKALNVSTTLTHSKHKIGMTDEELGINVLLRRKDQHDYDVRGKKGRDKVFPFVAKRRRNDEFGDIIRPEEYLRAEEREDGDGQDFRVDPSKADSAVGAKRKWGDADLTDPRKRPLNASNKRRKSGTDIEVNGEQAAKSVNGTNNDAEDESEESDYEPAEAIVRGPTKATFSTATMKLKLKIATIDFSGLHDKRSLQMLIPLIRPRKLILTGGDDEETTLLAKDSQQLLSADAPDSAKGTDEDIMSPSNGITVDASVDTNAWTIKLSQSLFKHLQWQKFRGLGIVTVNGRLEMLPAESRDEGDAKRQKVDAGGESAAKTAHGSPLLADLPTALAGSVRQMHHAVHVGDLRLAELRKIMQANGHTAEFKGEGTLLVDGLIAVRKSGIGKIEIESGGLAVANLGAKQASASFHNVKRKIYEGLAVVAAR